MAAHGADASEVLALAEPSVNANLVRGHLLQLDVNMLEDGIEM